MKLTNDQFEAVAYIFERANGNKKSEYEEKVIAESGLNNLKPFELETQIINGINNGLYSDSKERISAYWTLSKIDRNGSSAFNETELNLRDAENYLKNL